MIPASTRASGEPLWKMAVEAPDERLADAFAAVLDVTGAAITAFEAERVRALAQLVEAASEGLFHPLRDREAPDRGLARAVERAFLRQQVDDLGQEEGVALGLFVDAADEHRRGLEVRNRSDVGSDVIAG